MKPILLQTKDSISLMSWYKPTINNQPTVLFIHGNAGHIGYRMPLVRQFLNAGLGVLLLEYRGYGGNEGSPTEQGLYEDGTAAIHFLSQQHIASKQLVLYGESLGTAVVTRLAANHKVCAVVLQSPFTNLKSLSRYHYPWLLLTPWDRFDSLARMKQIHASVLVIHGKNDQVVPVNEGLTIYNQANEPKKIMLIDDKGHNDLWSTPGFAEDILGFIHTACGNR